ncbi:uncharacterized protein B0I36DRAFT_405354, partial [Microdochium trichocladiopsis]
MHEDRDTAAKAATMTMATAQRGKPLLPQVVSGSALLACMRNASDLKETEGIAGAGCSMCVRVSVCAWFWSRVGLDMPNCWPARSETTRNVEDASQDGTRQLAASRREMMTALGRSEGSGGTSRREKEGIGSSLWEGSGINHVWLEAVRDMIVTRVLIRGRGCLHGVIVAAGSKQGTCPNLKVRAHRYQDTSPFQIPSANSRRRYAQSASPRTVTVPASRQLWRGLAWPRR